MIDPIRCVDYVFDILIYFYTIPILRWESAWQNFSYKIDVYMEHFTSRIPFLELEATANKLKSVAHPVRLAILDLLMKEERLTVTEIQESLNIEQTATSYHLIQMKNKKVVKSEKKANKMFYSISNEQIPMILNLLLSS